MYALRNQHPARRMSARPVLESRGAAELGVARLERIILDLVLVAFGAALLAYACTSVSGWIGNEIAILEHLQQKVTEATHR